jgi:hypothetical protein
MRESQQPHQVRDRHLFTPRLTMFSMKASMSASVVVLIGTVLGGGCANEIDRVTDCQDICARYSDCFDASYDVSSCRTRCADNARDSETFDQQVDQCENCLDDRSCSSAVFGCTTECSTIVP